MKILYALVLTFALVIVAANAHDGEHGHDQLGQLKGGEPLPVLYRPRHLR